MTEAPRFIIIGGPNGSGKSTLTALRKEPMGVTIIDADAIARKLKPNNPIAAAGIAGRLAIQQLDQAIDEKRTVLQETTLSGRSLFNRIERAKAMGFIIELHYIGLTKWERAADRVEIRVLSGGHNVPLHDIERRYYRGLELLPCIMDKADWSFLYDNSSDSGHRLFAMYRLGKKTVERGSIPNWATELSEKIKAINVTTSAFQ